MYHITRLMPKCDKPSWKNPMGKKEGQNHGYSVGRWEAELNVAEREVLRVQSQLPGWSYGATSVVSKLAVVGGRP